MSWERWEGCELGRQERCMSGVRWQGGKEGDSVVAQSERWEGSEVEKQER